MMRVCGKQVAAEDNWTLEAESRTGENCVMKRLIICTLHLTFRVIELRRTGGEERVAHMGYSREVMGFWWGNLSERVQVEDLDLDWKIILKHRPSRKEWEVVD
jgi:hypothetical protein